MSEDTTDSVSPASEKLKELYIRVAMPPIAWKRPAGKAVRFDAQGAEKSAFSIAALKALVEHAPNAFSSRDVPLFKNGVEVSYVFEFTDATRCRRCDIDNLVKFAQDALQSGVLEGKVWTDDRIIYHIDALKTFSQHDRTTIKITGV